MSGPRRRRYLLIGGMCCAIALVGGVMAGRHLTSPRDAAARARPPLPGDVTAQLALRSLSVSITAPGSELPAGGYVVAAGSAAGAGAVVTGVAVRAGTRLADGALLADVSGEPLIAASLAFPLYRDIVVGDTGPDVTQVEGLLTRTGYLRSQPTRVDAAVRAGVGRFLADRGYSGLLGRPGPSSVVLKRSWLARVDRPNRLISRVDIHIGSTLTDPATAIVRCDLEAPAVRAVIDHSGAAHVRVGDRAIVLDNRSGAAIPTQVRSVGRSTAAGVPIVVGAEDPATLAGLSTDLVVTISARIGRTAVLAAPVTALYTDIDGTSHVLRAGPVPADDRPVPVTVGACASGWCQIERSASTLKAGDLVVVGRTGAHVDD